MKERFKIEGVSPDASVVVNEKGGKQSDTEYAFHLCDFEALLAIAKRLQYGVRRGYPRDNWRLIPAEEHFNHMLIHSLAAIGGDTTDEHLDGMICRAMMFYATAKQEQRNKVQNE
jgi:hypothetical protein